MYDGSCSVFRLDLPFCNIPKKIVPYPETISTVVQHGDHDALRVQGAPGGAITSEKVEDE